MYSYALLEPGCYYLAQEIENGPVVTIKVNVESDHCLYVTKYADVPILEWKKKNDSLFDIIECLTDEKVKEWESVYNASQDAYYEEEEDDE
ncbi:MAG: hypothetical protein H7Y31_02620 [Chitinophagaceae bacterium]|nr:hypothetical protein [Chitinophagaceae bacterium]